MLGVAPVMRKLQVTEGDRLLAAGLLSFIVAFLLLGWGATNSARGLMVLGVFATGALVFSVSPFRHGSHAQRRLALLFMVPVLAFLLVLAKALVSGEFVR
jgi:hypothetical protein